VVDPALHAGIYILEGELAAGVGIDQPAQFAPVVYSFSAFQATLVGINDEAEERNAFGHRSRVGAGMNGEAQTGQAFDNGISPVPQRTLVIGESQEIIHKAQIGGTTQLPLDEMVEGIHEAIGPELAGEIAYR